MDILRVDGLDLPIHKWGRSQVLVEKNAFRQAAQDGVPSFLRLCLTGGPALDTLSVRVSRAENGFKRVAKLCGATVLPHKYGVLHISPKQQARIDPFITTVLEDQSRRSNLLPTDHVLVAAVPAVLEETPALAPYDEPQATQLAEGIAAYAAEVAATGEGIRDVDEGQFMHGRMVVAPELPGARLYVDIEPITTG
jgi:hypothetical protein